ncbi:MaoC family dehydratase [Haematospirillum jordaniae]|uniref:Dehydratase n=1 Tax=Haematospirillum jordaniae TaxID=1549855 RepID=A0A143DC65_9PROT|nr:MaoC family dehydratase [Haematospirillum jordaniae]AMW34120.1 dehydratase [Haematospirillum jordaniae]NKD45235.1 MaoC family dehydratase [Haematospirillum jordaniae]NKD57227.1 MaoC family dehydratase [Haematospirillum jordaniae]NKD59582.1 MaoC family dehydratase [Haematospirillum jordaniae]NKD67153.1 MaoC family dehydratase [Haematospirillum jordaniae]
MNSVVTGFAVDSPVHYFEDIIKGAYASFSKTVTEADMVLFAGISGDTNPIHINQEFAERTAFAGRIVHGMLSAGFISTVLGMKLPGPGAVYMSQTLNFRAPVRVGDTVTARAEVIDLIPEKRVVVLQTVCLVKEKVVLDGEARMTMPSRQRHAR